VHFIRLIPYNTQIPAADIGDLLHFRQTSLTLAQRLFRAYALCDVLYHGSAEAEIAGIIANRR
jgi:hypothetical protein